MCLQSKCSRLEAEFEQEEATDYKYGYVKVV